MCRIRTGRPLRVARTSLCRRKLHPSNCRMDVFGRAAIFLQSRGLLHVNVWLLALVGFWTSASMSEWSNRKRSAPNDAPTAPSDDDTTFPHFATNAIHAGHDPDQWKCHALVPGIFLSTTFKQDKPGEPVSEHELSVCQLDWLSCSLIISIYHQICSSASFWTHHTCALSSPRLLAVDSVYF